MMMRAFLTSLSFISAILFPWPLTAVLVIVLSALEPLLPLAIGLFVDTLYYTPYSGAIPLFTFYGALITTVAFFVRSRLRASPASNL